MEPMYTGSYQVAKDDYTSAGHASADIKRQLKQIGVSGDVLRRVAVASYEVELNLVIHSLGGVLTLNVYPDCVQLVSTDVGPTKILSNSSAAGVTISGSSCSVSSSFWTGLLLMAFSSSILREFSKLTG